MRPRWIVVCQVLLWLALAALYAYHSAALSRVEAREREAALEVERMRQELHLLREAIRLASVFTHGGNDGCEED